MKIRMKGNSIRLRLTRPEVAQFCQEGTLTERVEIGAATFSYTLLAKAGLETLEASYAEDILTIYMPKDITETWAHNDRVGHDNGVAWDNGTELALLVEKDFTCLDNTTEDQSQNYPHPKKQ